MLTAFHVLSNSHFISNATILPHPLIPALVPYTHSNSQPVLHSQQWQLICVICMWPFMASTQCNTGVSPVVCSGLENRCSFTRSCLCGSWHKAEYSERRMLICSLLTKTLTEKERKRNRETKRIQKGLQPKYTPSPCLKISNDLINS